MKIFILIFQIVLSKSKKDFYEILDIRRNASKKQMKKAYRKLVKKYHPDNNQDKPKYAKKKFIEITKAYETLSDDTKKDLYDRGGEEMVDKAEQQQNQGGGGGGGFGGGGFSFEDIFSSFGGGGGGFGGGGQRQRQRQRGGSRFNFGGGDFEDMGFGNGRQKQQKQKREKINLTECINLIEMTSDNQPDLAKLDNNYNVLYYDQQSRESYETQFYKQFCEKFGQDLKIAAVDCSVNSDICQGMNLPSYYLYYSNNRKIKIKIYQGLKLQFLVHQNMKVMQNNVIRLNNDNYNQIVQDNFGKKIFILFTKRKKSGLMMMNLAIKNKKIVFCEIFYKNNLIKNFKINKFPSLMNLTDSLNFKGEMCQEDLNKKSIIKFINQQSKKSQGVQELTVERIAQGSCGGKDKNFCFLVLVEKDLKKVREILKEFSNEYKNDKINFFYLKKDKIDEKKFGIVFGGNQILVLRGKRNKYSGLEKGVGVVDKQDIYDLIDGILGGGLGKMKKYEDLNTLFKQLQLILILMIKNVWVF